MAYACVGVLFVVQLLGGVLCSPAGTPKSNVLVSIETVADIGAYRRAHPELTLVDVPLQATKLVGQGDASGRQQIVYTLGSRTAGDRLVGLSSDNKSWSSPQDVKLNLQYPTAGSGAVVSYVEVVVNQSTAQGRGYVVSGGVGQRYVQLVIEAYSTVYFNYSAAIYGF